MGNEASQLEEKDFLNESYDESIGLDNPDVDRQINSGTTAPNCQPKHTQKEVEEGLEVTMDGKDKVEVIERNGSMDRKEDGKKKQKPNYIQMAKIGYQEIVNAIIRPPRADYKVRLLVRC